MLEILLIVALCKKIGRVVREKGYASATGYQALAVVLWIGGEVAGGFTGGIISAIVSPNNTEPDLCAAYGLALLGAVIGATIAYTIASNLPPAGGDKFYDPIEGYQPPTPPAPASPPEDNPFRLPDDRFRR